MRQLTTTRARIAASGEESTDYVDFRAYKLVAVRVPSGWTAAAIAFLCAPGLDQRGAPSDDYALAFALEVTADTYRVLTEDEQAMARALAITQIGSRDDSDLTDPVTQVSAVELVFVVEPRG